MDFRIYMAGYVLGMSTETNFVGQVQMQHAAERCHCGDEICMIVQQEKTDVEVVETAGDLRWAGAAKLKDLLPAFTYVLVTYTGRFEKNFVPNARLP